MPNSNLACLHAKCALVSSQTRHFTSTCLYHLLMKTKFSREIMVSTLGPATVHFSLPVPKVVKLSSLMESIISIKTVLMDPVAPFNITLNLL